MSDPLDPVPAGMTDALQISKTYRAQVLDIGEWELDPVAGGQLEDQLRLHGALDV